jgi:hypothetical protein
MPSEFMADVTVERRPTDDGLLVRVTEDIDDDALTAEAEKEAPLGVARRSVRWSNGPSSTRYGRTPPKCSTRRSRHVSRWRPATTSNSRCEHPAVTRGRRPADPLSA